MRIFETCVALGLLSGMVIAVSCTSSETLSPAAAREIVEQVNAKAAKAANTGDLASLLAAYTEDPILLPPDEEIKRGREAVKDFWEGLIAQDLSNLKLETLHLDVAEGLMAEVGRFSFRVRPEGEGATPVSGTFVVIWKQKPDGSWGWAVDILFSDPAPG
jgi:ketosteroid isomerase-like protein